MKRLLVLASALALLACESSTAPLAGLLKINLTTPNSGGDGAILLTVNGPAVLTSVAAAGGLRLFSEPLATSNTLSLTGTLVNGTILTVGVTDTSKASSYTATISQVSELNYQLRNLSGYSLTVAH
jgi:hypothetical protein